MSEIEHSSALWQGFKGSRRVHGFILSRDQQDSYMASVGCTADEEIADPTCQKAPFRIIRPTMIV